MSDEQLHPIQREMRRLEDAIRHDPKNEVPIDEVIARFAGIDAADVDDGFDKMLLAECNRAVELMEHYGPIWEGRVTRAFAYATVGFLQGVTFAAAVRNVREQQGC